jgi:superfamily II DNA or RNA helicase
MVFKIHVIDGIMAQAPKPLIPYIKPLLRYDKEVALQGQFGTNMKRQPAHYIDGRNGKFLCGFLDRVCGHLTARHIMWSITGNMVQPIKPQTEPMLNGITLRPDQLELVNQIAIYQRGVIKAPTGSGKTITALGAVSMFPGMRVLILVHRKEILKQFADRIYKHLALRGHPQLILEGNRPQLHGTVVAMIQTFVKYPVEEVCDKFDIVMIDEVHRCWDRKGQYGQFLNGCLAPMKIGFSATPWDAAHRERMLGTEGLVGPPIGELTVAEGQELGIIVKPYITLKIVPYDASVGDYRRYRELYQYGIVENRARNAIIIKEAKARAMANKSSLIIIREIRHGHLLVEMAQRMGLKVLFVHGGTPGKQRATAKEALERKTHLTVIASDIWEEGIDIVSLNTVVAAGAGKSKRKTLQIVGRGMRTAPGKDRVEVIDFLDPYRYLARHAVARFTAYAEKGWL